MERKHIQQQKVSGYQAGPPWFFSGRAFYQLHLVKVDVAKRFIPSDLSIVQAFGYTLGGLYLAQYDTSPADVFDELVVIAGIVWNAPTSCAWAARVLVNSKVACDHGKQEVGLPSTMANFLKGNKYEQKHDCRQWSSLSNFWNRKMDFEFKKSTIGITELDGHLEKPLCNMVFPIDYGLSQKHCRGPSISLSLPSFSGRTEAQPHLLKYTCQLKCRVNPVGPAIIIAPLDAENGGSGSMDSLHSSILSVLVSKPLIALCFENMEMRVEAAKVVSKSNPSNFSFGVGKC